MTWILSLVSLPKLIAGIGALLLFVLGALGLRKGGKDALRAQQAKDAAKRSEAGRSAAGKAKAKIDAGKTPEDIVKGHDAKW
jgi:hypothetical protein